MAANYGALSGTKFKNAIDEAYDQEGNLTDEGRAKVKEIFTMILQREIARTYKVPNDAFTAFDRVGNNYITASDIVNSKMAYRLPFKKDELRYFLEQQSIFKRVPRLSIDNFIKYLFPERNRGDTQEAKRGASESSSESGNDSFDTSTGGSAARPTRRPAQGGSSKKAVSIDNSSSYGGSTLQSTSLKSQKVAEQVKHLEELLKKKLSVDFNSVRKAFLAIDDNHRGYITAEHLAKFLGASKQKNFDFTLLEILIKLHTKELKTRLNYNDFCAWLGNSIEPTETFFFRHDSKKNPQFEVSLQKNIAKNEPNQQTVSSIMTRNNLKEKLIQRTFS